MRIAITEHENRISPVFDSSQWLYVFDADETSVESFRDYIGNRSPFGKIVRLKDLDVDVLICGAITRPLQFDLFHEHIQVYPFVCGDAKAILDDFLKNKRIDGQFTMPGYGQRRRRRQRGGSVY
jgi:predicted Fe-Mo cluster-binding NifX family protein